MNGKTMKAAVVPLLGGDWRVRDVAIPQPALDQVLIGVRASGLSSRTLSRRSRAGAGGLPSGGLRAAYRPRVRRRDRAQAADRLRQRRGRRTRETAAWVCPAELLRDHRRLPVPGLSCLLVALESPPAEVWAAHVERGNAGRRAGPTLAVGTQENRPRGPLVRRNPSPSRGRDNEQTQEDLSSRVRSRLPTTPNDGAGASQTQVPDPRPSPRRPTSRRRWDPRCR